MIDGPRRVRTGTFDPDRTIRVLERFEEGETTTVDDQPLVLTTIPHADERSAIADFPKH